MDNDLPSDLNANKITKKNPPVISTKISKTKKTPQILQKSKKGTKAKDNNKKTRKVLSLELKLEIIQLYENGAKVTKIGNDKDLRESTVRTVIKNKDKINLGRLVLAIITFSGIMPFSDKFSI